MGDGRLAGVVDLDLAPGHTSVGTRDIGGDAILELLVVVLHFDVSERPHSNLDHGAHLGKTAADFGHSVGIARGEDLLGGAHVARGGEGSIERVLERLARVVGRVRSDLGNL